MPALTQNLLQQPDVWIKRWMSIFHLAEDLLGVDRPPEMTPTQRLKALFDEQEEIERQITESAISQNSKETDVDYVKLVKLIARSMILFSAQQFAFFLDGFHDTQYVEFDLDLSPQTAEQPLSRYQIAAEQIGGIDEIDYKLADYALRIVMNQITDDVLLLRDILTQYQSDANGVFAELKTANQLALLIWEFLRSYLPDTGTALTYLRRSASLRLIPYSSVALISIPPSSLVLDQDYLALPHEFGHFLYRRGRLPASQGDPAQSASYETFLFDEMLQKWAQEQGYPEWLLRWLEEIFADVVGCLIGGPVVALSLQEMLMEKVGDLFTRADGDYPMPAVRPYTTFGALKKMGWPKASSALEEQWGKVLKQRRLEDLDRRAVTLLTKYYPQIRTEESTLGEVRCWLEKAGADIAVLLEEHGLTTSPGQMVWKVSEVDDDDLNALHEKFERFVDEVKSSMAPVAVQKEEAPASWLKTMQLLLDEATGQQLEETLSRSAGNWSLDVLWNQPDESAESVRFPSDKWLSILFSVAWGNAGPSGGSPHFI